MDQSLKPVLIFTMLYGLFTLGMLSFQPPSASIRIADAVGNFEPDAPSVVHLALARAE